MEEGRDGMRRIVARQQHSARDGNYGGKERGPVPAKVSRPYRALKNKPPLHAALILVHARPAHNVTGRFTGPAEGPRFMTEIAPSGRIRASGMAHASPKTGATLLPPSTFEETIVQIAT